MPTRRLILIATAKKWNLALGADEIGNALYPLDNEVLVELDKAYPIIYVFSGKLSSWRAFQAIVREPPAYLERLVPVEKLVNQRVHCDSEGVELPKELVDVLARILHSLEAVNVEAKPRKYYVTGKCSEKEFNRFLARFIARQFDIHVLRRAARVLKFEDTRYGIVLALINNGWDRLSFWRTRRLGEISAAGREDKKGITAESS
ncbi:hypothetical protein [Hyperthermus butylicus]|uniref:Uncharacterized protein n=1 Tax=Hyperthermus butylicus (strain DSM 5456 / JCM 9403 / PLM1-5) TaxID=415426 RepID=A2BL97_HYPBU|nr:hypothetical protein [Hyperthermus butylicus]ABM80758.1 hypothetical protein Hbut_0910 [Hyperthermus butylicus DSM 5456]